MDRLDSLARDDTPYRSLGDAAIADEWSFNRDTIAQGEGGEAEIALAHPRAAGRHEHNARTGRAEKSVALAARAADLGRALAGLDVAQRIAGFREALGGGIVLTTGFG